MCAKSILCQSLTSFTPDLYLKNLTRDTYQIIALAENLLNSFGIGLNFFIYYNFNKAFSTAFGNLVLKIRNKIKLYK